MSKVTPIGGMEVFRFVENVPIAFDIASCLYYESMNKNYYYTDKFDPSFKYCLTRSEYLVGITEVNTNELFKRAANFPNLKVLECKTSRALTKIPDLPPGLEMLILIGAETPDISPVLKCMQLKYLGILDNKIKSIDGIDRLQELKVLDLRFNEITDISPVTGLPKLGALLVCYNKIKKLPARLPSTLKMFWIKENNISDISSVAYCTELLEFIPSYNSIEDFNAMEKLSKLRHRAPNMFYPGQSNLNAFDQITMRDLE
jgi:Leucine-rich repeat (LRR) protein